MDIRLLLTIIGVPVYLILVVYFWRYRQWLLYYLLAAFGLTMLVALPVEYLGWDYYLVGVEIFHVSLLGKLMNIPAELLESGRIMLENDVGASILKIGIECSGVLEASVLVGLVAFYPVFSLRRKLLKIIFGLSVTYVINLLRILIIVLIVAKFGTEYAFIAHAVIARLFFFALSIALYWYILTRPTLKVVGEAVEQRKLAYQIREGLGQIMAKRTRIKIAVILIIFVLGSGSFAISPDWRKAFTRPADQPSRSLIYSDQTSVEEVPDSELFDKESLFESDKKRNIAEKDNDFGTETAQVSEEDILATTDSTIAQVIKEIDSFDYEDEQDEESGFLTFKTKITCLEASSALSEVAKRALTASHIDTNLNFFSSRTAKATKELPAVLGIETSRFDISTITDKSIAQIIQQISLLADDDYEEEEDDESGFATFKTKIVVLEASQTLSQATKRALRALERPDVNLTFFESILVQSKLPAVLGVEASRADILVTTNKTITQVIEEIDSFRYEESSDSKAKIRAVTTQVFRTIEEAAKLTQKASQINARLSFFEPELIQAKLPAVLGVYSERYKIIDGPKKSNLWTSLFREGENCSECQVKFTLENHEGEIWDRVVEIDSATRVDASGILWDLVGHDPQRPERFYQIRFSLKDGKGECQIIKSDKDKPVFSKESEQENE
ncbi:hypothetical protein ACFL14_00545 [Patescibacteria group bacterium]